jgi:hypothetical protein
MGKPPCYRANSISLKTATPKSDTHPTVSAKPTPSANAGITRVTRALVGVFALIGVAGSETHRDSIYEGICALQYFCVHY